MEFVKTPTFWCPHVDQAACTNFSLRTVKLRPLKSREIFPFPFLLSHFPSFPSLRIVFLFPFLVSHLIFPSHFLIFSFGISPPFWSTPLIRSKEAISSPLPSSYHLCGLHISFHFPYFLILFYYITHLRGSL